MASHDSETTRLSYNGQRLTLKGTGSHICEPVTIAMATVAGAQATASIVGQNTARQAAKGAENQKRIAQDDLIMENRKRATKDYLREVRLDQLQQAQEMEALGEKSLDISHQAESAKGTAMASAAERGVAGRGLETILSDYDFQQNQEVGRLRINQLQENRQHGENLEAYKDQFTQRYDAVKPYIPRQQPPVDYFGPIFGGISSTLSGGAQMGAFKSASSVAPTSATAPGKTAWGTY
jgi:hypothetical protein